MKKTSSRKHTLYFLSVITGLLKRCGVKSRKKDKRLADSNPLTGELELQI